MDKRSPNPVNIVMVAVMTVAIALLVVMHADPAQTLIGMLLGVFLMVVLVNGGKKRILEKQLGPQLRAEMESGQPFRAEVTESILRCVKEGRKIEAIKELREISGLGLKEAKDKIDELHFRISSGQHLVAGIQAPSSRVLSVDAAPELVELVRAGHMIEAIKFQRDKTGMDLSSAKEFVDRIAADLKHEKR
ncbi:MAG: ribosomal protein L7/L12 [Candidatus Obscuribacterales bacterium]|nr:ribosomal protein L7/L12 [Candidatus Obscuribacterales bacterium]